ncbi:hypothetical protein HCG51_33490 [Tolypothrix sp. PCC 7910]|uniref:hypothetical protein n=1 Tax=Tolypothrix sp. PCC 7910 TaxID=2099387 RepID=UPI00142796AC|nr:hypothetical protein [Tolypothrix sp. PCC 7910]QIR41115.1 hypothetical protein HCG51_33490 [Tolypothrix sp. PCC 7910]
MTLFAILAIRLFQQALRKISAFIANAIALVISAIAFAILRAKLRKTEILIGIISNRTGGASSP